MIYDATKAVLLIVSAYLFLKEEPETFMGMQTLTMAMIVGIQKDISVISAVLIRLLNIKEDMKKGE